MKSAVPDRTSDVTGQSDSSCSHPVDDPCKPTKGEQHDTPDSNLTEQGSDDEIAAKETRRAVSIPYLATLYQIPRSYLYERSRHNDLPGLRRIGKRYVRVNIYEFDEYVKSLAGKPLDENAGQIEARETDGERNN